MTSTKTPKHTRKPIRVSVRKLVELVHRSGDIDSRYSDTAEAMQNGAKAHRMLQKAYPETFQKEVAFSQEVQIAGLDVILQGRADGVGVLADGTVVIDEIKTTTLPLAALIELAPQHLGQAKCYAYMKMHQSEPPLETITVQLTYYQIETDTCQRQQFHYSREELSSFFEELCEKYGKWLTLETEWRVRRNRSISELSFPFPAYRAGQRKLAVAVYRSIEHEKRLYVQAPTGIGKTISTLFPAVKSIAEGHTERLFYLTAKTVTRAVAQDAAALMQQQGLQLRAITLRAKEKLCFLEQSACNPEQCPYAKGHFDRINDALYSLLTAYNLLTPERVADHAQQYRVCPHELALDASLWSDLIIGDYNHVFDPVVYLHRFFSDTKQRNPYTFLIDEAHNLPDRVRDLYTAALTKAAFYQVKKQLLGKEPVTAALRRCCNKLNRYFIDLRKTLETAGNAQTTAENDPAFEALLHAFVAAAGEWVTQDANRALSLHQPLLQLFFDARRFLLIASLYDSHYCCIKELQRGDVTVTYYCLDPSAVTAQGLDRARAAVLFSATFSPLGYYRQILGGAHSDYLLSIDSPFSPEHLRLAAHTGISTKYRDRTDSVAPIAACIQHVFAANPGNYLVFFPSYEYLNTVYEHFREAYPDTPTALQAAHMEEEAREAFLCQFDGSNAGGLVGFCVLGGIFSEGIDLTGNRLVGVLVVGVGLPKLSLRQNLIADYYQRQGHDGYAFAYTFPGMNKVLQAAGRVIRTESDRGVVLLIDSRFASQTYRRLYPPHWAHLQYLRGKTELQTFFPLPDTSSAE